MSGLDRRRCTLDIKQSSTGAFIYYIYLINIFNITTMLTLCSIYMIAHVIIQTVRDCDRSSGLTAKGVRCSRRTCKLDRVVFNRAIQVCIDSSSRAAVAAESA
jgi:hypothetical protein